MKRTVTFDIPEGWIGCNFAEMVIINERDTSQSKKIYGVMRVVEENITSLPITRTEMEEYLGVDFDDCK